MLDFEVMNKALPKNCLDQENHRTRPPSMENNNRVRRCQNIAVYLF